MPTGKFHKNGHELWSTNDWITQQKVKMQIHGITLYQLECAIVGKLHQHKQTCPKNKPLFCIMFANNNATNIYNSQLFFF